MARREVKNLHLEWFYSVFYCSSSGCEEFLKLVIFISNNDAIVFFSQMEKTNKRSVGRSSASMQMHRECRERIQFIIIDCFAIIMNHKRERERVVEGMFAPSRTSGANLLLGAGNNEAQIIRWDPRGFVAWREIVSTLEEEAY